MPYRARGIFGLPVIFWNLWLGVLVNRLGGFIMTFLAIYLRTGQHLSVEKVGLTMSLFGAGSFLAGPLGGTLADRIGRKKTMLLSLSTAVCTILNLGSAHSFSHILWAAFLAGLCMDMVRPAVNAAVADIIEPEDRTRAFGLLYWSINLGFAGSAILAGVLAKYDLWLLFAGDATTTFLYGLLILFFVPETHPRLVQKTAAAPEPNAPIDEQALAQTTDVLAPYRDRSFLTFIFVQIVLNWVFLQGVLTLPLAMTEHGVPLPRYGLLMSINGFMIITLQPLAIRILPHIPRGVGLAGAAMLYGIGFGICGLGHSEWLYALSIVIYTIGEILMAPMTATLVTDMSTPALRGGYQGGFMLSWGTAMFLGPLLGGKIMGTLGENRLWLLCFCLGTLGAVAHLLAIPARKRRIAQIADEPERRAALARELGHPTVAIPL